MIDVYAFSTPNSVRVPIALEELGLDYTLHAINVRQGEQKSTGHLARNPNGKVPVIVDSDGPDGQPFTLGRIGAILIYLAEKTGKLMPADRFGRARVIEQMLFHLTGIGPAMGQLGFFKRAPEPVSAAIDRFQAEVERTLGVLDRHLADRDYVAGDSYSIADITHFGWLWRREFAGIELDAFPNVARWYERVAALLPCSAASPGSRRWCQPPELPCAGECHRPKPIKGLAMQVSGKRIVITGGSSGIGYALAQALLARGAQVMIVGRDADKATKAARQLSSGSQGACGRGRRGTEAGRTAILAGARQHLGGLDVLVNNAGGVRAGRLEAIDEGTIRRMIDVNLLAPILLTRQALPMLRESGDAVVLNVASAIALVGVPFYAVYAATKAGLARFGEALRRELKSEGVHVITAYPGGTDTPMMRSNHAGPDLGFSLEPAADVAEAMADGLATDAFEVVRGGQTRTEMIALNRTDPAALDARFAGLKAALEDAVREHQAM